MEDADQLLWGMTLLRAVKKELEEIDSKSAGKQENQLSF